MQYCDHLAPRDYGTSPYALRSAFTAPLMVRIGHELVTIEPDVVAMQLVRRPKLYGGLAWHEAVLYQREGQEWRVFDRRPDGIRDEAWADVEEEGPWEFVADVPYLGLADAAARMERVRAEPGRFHAVDRNCQHTARWIAFGQPESPAVQGAAAVGLVALGVWLSKRPRPRRRRR